MNMNDISINVRYPDGSGPSCSGTYNPSSPLAADTEIFMSYLGGDSREKLSSIIDKFISDSLEERSLYGSDVSSFSVNVKAGEAKK